MYRDELRLSYKGFSPGLIDPAVAAVLPPTFVFYLENLWTEIDQSFNHLLPGYTLYAKPPPPEKLTALMVRNIEWFLKHNQEAQLWFALEETPSGMRLRSEMAGLLAAHLARDWALEERPSNSDEEYLPLPQGICHLGHAGVAIRNENQILIDPVLYKIPPGSQVAGLSPANLRETEAVFLTHHHSDHFDLSTFKYIARETPVYVPARKGGEYEGDLPSLLRTMGFTGVHEVNPGERIPLKQGAFMDVLNFFGEGSELSGFAGRCYLYSGHGRRVLFDADASPNFEGQSILDCEAFARCLSADGPVDTVFATWWQKKSFLYQLSPTVLLRHPLDDWFTAVESCDCPIEFVTALVKKSGARRFVAYAELGAQRFLHEEKRDTFLENESFHWRPRAEYKSAVGSLGVEWFDAEPRRAY